ncbi:aminoacyl-tRNA hydrolase [Helicobacter mastomyrinus]|uniref:Peptidyl-tRNA hydrolase n=2 Tax=Helicobacter TaxID=209 RepID=A0ABZ3F7Y2_9HELI|nr:aminoacyl-tRNA hydrolase [uncultured Helicobacter sp.]
MSCLLVAGLGNPGVKYQNTRHNVGFMVLDFLSKTLNFTFHFDKKFNAEVGTLHTDSHKVFFLKPLTFMNLSGESIAPFARYFDIAHTLIIHDDIDIAFGDIRFKYGGSSGGHNGLKSIDKAMGDKYLRLRFGIGRDTQGNVIDYVLSDFNTQEIAQITQTLPFIQFAIAYFYTMQGSIEDILAHLQNRFTLRNKSQKPNKDSINITKQNIRDKR